MNSFEFYNPVKVVFGAGEVSKAGEEVAKLGKKALLVSYEDHGFFVDLLNKVEKLANDNGVETVTHYKITANPKLTQVEAGVALAKAEGVDCVIGIGGGSAMDAAKCIAAGVLYKEELAKMVASAHDGSEDVIFPSEALPMMMIPTLPATGSEMNCCGVVTNDYIGKKSYVWDNCLYPQVSVVDPELTCTLPAYQTACGAADTMSHVLEFYINGLEGTPLNYYIQEGVCKTVMQELPKVLENPNDVAARSNLQWSSIMALNGISQPGDAWTPMHQLGHVISAQYNTAHGATLAIVMPAWMRHMYKTRLDRYVRFATELFNVDTTGKTDEEVALAGIDAFEAFMRGIGIPTRLSDIDVTADKTQALADAVVAVSFGADGKMHSHTPVTPEDVKAVFDLAL